MIGRVTASAYAGQDGSAKASLELTADSVRFLGGGRDGAAPAGNGAAVPEPMDEEEVFF